MTTTFHITGTSPFIKQRREGATHVFSFWGMPPVGRPPRGTEVKGPPPLAALLRRKALRCPSCGSTEVEAAYYKTEKNMTYCEACGKEARWNGGRLALTGGFWFDA